MAAGGVTRVATLGARFDEAMARFDTAPALRVADDVITYRQLGARVDEMTGRLVASGIGHGSPVALSAANSVDFVVSVVAMARIGAIAVMVSTAWRDHEVGHAIELAAPTHLLHDASGAVRIDERFPDLIAIDLRDRDADAASGAGTGAAGLPPVSPDDLAMVFFSSGTTGMPKAVRHTHRSMQSAIEHWGASLGLTAADRLQIATPPFHILGLLNVVTVLAHGASMRLHRRFELDRVLSAIASDRVTIEMAVAPIALAMAQHPDLERFDLSSLRFILWGATPVTASVADTVTRRTGVRFLAGYGATELPVLAVNPVDRPDEWRLDSVGLPPDGVELRVVDLATGAPAAPGEPGEIEGRSESMMSGYLPEEANVDAFHDGWYRTGDVGTIDHDGWVTVTDRVKEMIKVRGFQVAPAEIEALLLARPDVADCAVFGVPDPAAGEAIVAAIVPREGAAVAPVALGAEVSAQLATYKQINEVVVVDRIPRLPSGKVLRRDLQANHRS
jgi:acyl-CoA synthetase (AMP-forming)/AMP-acid ligase II